MRFGKQIFLTAALLLFTIAACFAELIDPETGSDFKYNAELVEVAPIVDGYLDDLAWEGVIPGKMEQDVIENTRWHDSNDFAGSFAAVWRNGFLYLAVKLTDDSPETYHAKLDRQDYLELYFDIDHSGHKSPLYRYVIPVGENAPQSESPFMLVAWRTDRQSCELSFNLRHAPQKGESIGFGIFYNDVDGGHFHHKIGWAPRGYTEENEFLPDLVFSSQLKLNVNQKAEQWGRIKTIYSKD